MSKDTKKIEIFIMGKQYLVPGELTILEAMEYAGYQLKRGCGCRAGFCGACATVYRIAGSYQLQVGLACQTKVEPGCTWPRSLLSRKESRLRPGKD